MSSPVSYRFFELSTPEIENNCVSCVNCRHWKVRLAKHRTRLGTTPRAFVLCWKLHHPARRLDNDKVAPGMFDQARERAVECLDFDPMFVED